jgi:K+-sensing histidine kinase KdpD
VSADARPQGPAARGRLRIYLGYAPGAGTTCALLSEGRRRAEQGTDVVAARAETHGRPHTEDLLAGLEVIPSAKVPYRGTLAEEMDLGAVLACGPAVPSRWRRSRQRSGPGAGGGRAQRRPGGRDPDPPGGPDRRLVRRGPAGGAAARPGRPAGSGQAGLAAQRQLAESAGDTYHQLADEDIPAALLAFAHAYNATQLVLGATPRTWLTALRPAASIRSRVIRRGGGLDVHLVTCTPHRQRRPGRGV